MICIMESIFEVHLCPWLQILLIRFFCGLEIQIKITWENTYSKMLSKSMNPVSVKILNSVIDLNFLTVYVLAQQRCILSYQIMMEWMNPDTIIKDNPSRIRQSSSSWPSKTLTWSKKKSDDINYFKTVFMILFVFLLQYWTRWLNWRMFNEHNWSNHKYYGLPIQKAADVP